MTLEEIAEFRQRRYNGTVVLLRKPNPDLMILRVRPDFGVPPHQPGQYTSLGLGTWEPRFPGCQDENPADAGAKKLVRRAYSLSCPILDDTGRLFDLDQTAWVEFYIVLVRETGDPNHAPGLTPRLFMLREGDRLQIGERFTGHFTLQNVNPNDTVLFLSTGTGEAPHNYMLWKLLSNGHRGKIVSLCCVRYRDDLGYRATHEKIANDFNNYTYIPLTTREAKTAGAKVYIQDWLTSKHVEEVLGRPLDRATTHVYLCGNPKMIGIKVKDPATGARKYPQPVGVIEVLERRYGFQCDDPAAKVRGQIHFEKFW